jgi:endogenous inhibitor of DNA gyrase (YacG/DUF329 family)
MDTTKTCPVCGEPVPPSTTRGRPKIYCSEKCRHKAKRPKTVELVRKWRAANPEKVREKQRARYAAKRKLALENAGIKETEATCAHCGNQFIQKAKKNPSPYCSRECYRRKAANEWRALNHEMASENKSAWYAANRDSQIQKGRARLAQKINGLADDYVVSLITKKTPIKPEAVPKSLIELKRVQLQITRKLKELKK